MKNKYFFCFFILMFILLNILTYVKLKLMYNVFANGMFFRLDNFLLRLLFSFLMALPIYFIKDKFKVKVFLKRYAVFVLISAAAGMLFLISDNI